MVALLYDWALGDTRQAPHETTNEDLDMTININAEHDATEPYLQAGETIVISSAAGQIGHLVGQIAKYLNIFFVKFVVYKAFPFKTKHLNNRSLPLFNNDFSILRILGLRVLGYTGDGDKASWIKTDLGFDWAFNYKTQDVNQTLNIAAPNGVIWFEILSSFADETVLCRSTYFGTELGVTFQQQ